MGTQPLSKKGAEPPIFGPFLLRPNGCMDQDATWYGGRPRPRRHCVRWGPSSRPQKGGRAPRNFRPISIVAKRLDASRIEMPLFMEVGLSPGDFVLDGDPPPSPKRGGAPNFRPRLLWPNGCMDEMPLGMEVGLGLRDRGLRDIVLDGDLVPPHLEGHSLPIFGQCPLWPNGWMD